MYLSKLDEVEKGKTIMYKLILRIAHDVPFLFEFFPSGNTIAQKVFT